MGHEIVDLIDHSSIGCSKTSVLVIIKTSMFEISKIAVFLLALSCFAVGLAYECSLETCQPPLCKCASTSIPGGFPAVETPQFITLTVDGSIFAGVWNGLLDDVLGKPMPLDSARCSLRSSVL